MRAVLGLGRRHWWRGGPHPEWRRPLLAGVALLATLLLGGWRASLASHLALTAGADCGGARARRSRGDRGDVATVAVAEVQIAGTWRGATAPTRGPTRRPRRRSGAAIWLGVSATIAPPPRSRRRVSARRWNGAGSTASSAPSARACWRTPRARRPERRRLVALTALEEGLRRHIPGAGGGAGHRPPAGRDRRRAPQRTLFDATSTSHAMAERLEYRRSRRSARWWGGDSGAGRSRLWLAGSALALWASVFFVGGADAGARGDDGHLDLVAEELGGEGTP